MSVWLAVPLAASSTHIFPRVEQPREDVKFKPRNVLVLHKILRHDGTAGDEFRYRILGTDIKKTREMLQQRPLEFSDSCW